MAFVGRALLEIIVERLLKLLQLDSLDEAKIWIPTQLVRVDLPADEMVWLSAISNGETGRCEEAVEFDHLCAS